MAQSCRVTEGHWHRVVMKTEAGLGQPADEGCKSPELAATGAVSVHAIQTGGSWWGEGAGMRLAEVRAAGGQCSMINSVVSRSQWRVSVNFP